MVPNIFDEDRKVYFFDCPDKPDLNAATLDSTGQNLPNLGSDRPWTGAEWLIIGPANRPFVEAMELALQTDGYHLHSTNSNFLDDKSIRAAVQALVKRVEDDEG
jgi:hypothetical protein